MAGGCFVDRYCVAIEPVILISGNTDETNISLYVEQ